VPTGARWQLLAFEAQLTTDATVATRASRLRGAASGLNVLISAALATVQASQQGTFDWAVGMPLATPIQAGVNVGGIPVDTVLLPGHTIGTLTQFLQAGDQWSAPIYTVREWLEVA
jgi:hypothetical protein